MRACPAMLTQPATDFGKGPTVSHGYYHQENYLLSGTRSFFSVILVWYRMKLLQEGYISDSKLSR